MLGEGLLVKKTAPRRIIDPGSDRHLATTKGDRGHMSRSRLAIFVTLEAFVSLCGVGGGIFMAAHPLAQMSLRYLRGTWFQTWRWPGVLPTWDS